MRGSGGSQELHLVFGCVETAVSCFVRKHFGRWIRQAARSALPLTPCRPQHREEGRWATSWQYTLRAPPLSAPGSLIVAASSASRGFFFPPPSAHYGLPRARLSPYPGSRAPEVVTSLNRRCQDASSMPTEATLATHPPGGIDILLGA